MNKSIEELESLLERFSAIGSNAYHQYVSLCRADACLGWEAKVGCGKFGIAELQTHKDAQEMLGRHRAYCEAAALLKETINNLKVDGL